MRELITEIHELEVESSRLAAQLGTAAPSWSDALVFTHLTSPSLRALASTHLTSPSLREGREERAGREEDG